VTFEVCYGYAIILCGEILSTEIEHFHIIDVALRALYLKVLIIIAVVEKSLINLVSGL
jgi:hypothetical protein